MQPVALARDLRAEYQRYIDTTFPILDPKLKRQIEEKIEDGSLLWKGPYISLNRPFSKGASINQLVQTQVLHPKTASIFRGWTLYDHQERATRRLTRGMHTLVASSTGSGKTESFLIPIIDYCLHEKQNPGVKAVLLYPMNALANDQLKRLRKLLKGTGITFGRYTGDTQSKESADYVRDADAPDEEVDTREEIQSNPPDILLTNYAMLEYLLVRRADQKIFRQRQVRFLVLDEVHTYGGALGIEVSCLIRRFKEHIGLSQEGLVCVGTSATVKGEDKDIEAVTTFASKLFGEYIGKDALIIEQFDPTPPLSNGYMPAVPTLDSELLNSFDPESDQQIKQLAEQLTGRQLSGVGDPGQQLDQLLEQNILLRLIEGHLEQPRTLDELTTYLRQQPERAEVAPQIITQEITAYLLLGPLARHTGGPRLRPKVHMLFRGLEGFTRCLECQRIWEAGIDTCPNCQGKAFPVEVCRTCGQDFWRTVTNTNQPPITDEKIQVQAAEHLHQITLFDLYPSLDKQSGAHTLHLTREIHPFENAEADEEDETEEEAEESEEPKKGGKVAAKKIKKESKYRSGRVYVCGTCGNASLNKPVDGVCAAGCGTMVQLFLYYADKLNTCPSCYGAYGNREVVTTFATGVAQSVTVLTSEVMKRLDEKERRLLIFSDNRQDTAFQAGYLNDKHRQFARRQLIYQVIHEQVKEKHDGISIKRLAEQVYKKGIELGVYEEIRNAVDREKEIQRLTWPILAEFASSGRRRITLQGLGLIKIKYAELEQRLAQNETAKDLRATYQLTEAEFLGIASTILEQMRTGRALDHELLLQPTYTQKDDEIIEGFERNRKPIGYGERSIKGKHHSYEVRQFAAEKGQTSQFQVYLKKILSLAEAAEATPIIREIVAILQHLDYMVERRIGKEGDSISAWMVNHRHVEFYPMWKGEGYQCRACRRVFAHNVRNICPNKRCDGSLERLKIQEKNYYVHTYRENDMVKITAREHSGQLDGNTREEYEKGFLKGDFNILVCTPTMELGVDIGDLPVVIMSNVPPGPANYAQRSGRAGRAERIAFIVSFARNRGHDSYYYDNPADMIRGIVQAPVFGFDNKRIISRHLRALLLEKLHEQLPSPMGKLIEDDETDQITGLQELFQELNTRSSTIEGAIIDAFRKDTEAGWLPWLTSTYIADLINTFPDALERAFQPWLHDRRGLLDELSRLKNIGRRQRTKDDDKRQRAIEAILYRLESDKKRAYTLSYLSRQGFLPTYVAAGEKVRMVPGYETREPLERGQDIALTEYAPGNFVYCDGNVYSITGIDIQRSEEPDQDAQYRYCPNCSMVTLSKLAQHCEGCELELRSHSYISANSFQGKRVKHITAEEENRAQGGYETTDYLIDDPTGGQISNGPAGFQLAHYRNTSIFSVNKGFVRKNNTVSKPTGFALCLTCGQWNDEEKPDWLKRHSKSCKGTPRAFHLAYTLETDVLTIDIPGLSLTPNEHDPFLVTLRHALVLGANIVLQTEDTEIGGFARSVQVNHQYLPQIVLYDDVPGGAGYVEQLSRMLPEVAQAAFQRLEHCDCLNSCYRCLRTFNNQREHTLLDKRLIRPILQQIAGIPERIS